MTKRLRRADTAPRLDRRGRQEAVRAACRRTVRNAFKAETFPFPNTAYLAARGFDDRLRSSRVGSARSEDRQHAGARDRRHAFEQRTTRRHCAVLVRHAERRSRRRFFMYRSFDAVGCSAHGRVSSSGDTLSTRPSRLCGGNPSMCNSPTCCANPGCFAYGSPLVAPMGKRFVPNAGALRLSTILTILSNDRNWPILLKTSPLCSVIPKVSYICL